MVGLDTNLLVSAHRTTAPHHRESKQLLESLAGGPAPFALFWPCLYGFFRVVTHARIFGPPTPPEEALQQVRVMTRAPAVRLLAETDGHAEILRRIVVESGATGNLIHDAHLVVLAIEHGVDEILTFDRDFARFPQVRSRHPFRK